MDQPVFFQLSGRSCQTRKLEAGPYSVELRSAAPYRACTAISSRVPPPHKADRIIPNCRQSPSSDRPSFLLRQNAVIFCGQLKMAQRPAQARAGEQRHGLWGGILFAEGL